MNGHALLALLLCLWGFIADLHSLYAKDISHFSSIWCKCIFPADFENLSFSEVSQVAILIGSDDPCTLLELDVILITIILLLEPLIPCEL